MSAHRTSYVIVRCDHCGWDSHPVEADTAEQARLQLVRHGFRQVQVTWNKRVDLCPDCYSKQVTP